MSWVRKRPVFVGEDDVSGLIFFPTYFHYMNEGDQLLFERVGLPVHRQIAERLTMPAVHVECDYLAPARGGDVLTQTIGIRSGRRSSVTSEHEFRLGDEVVARGRVVRAFTDLDTLRPVELTTAVRSAIASAASGYGELSDEHGHESGSQEQRRGS